MCSCWYDLVNKIRFYSERESAILSVPISDLLSVTSDFNTQINNVRMQEKFLYGAFTSGGCSSDDGKRCVSLLTNKNLLILNNLQEQGTAPDK